MYRAFRTGVPAVVILALAGKAMALTLTNIRADPVTVGFMAGGDTHDINLGPGESSEEACDKGCLLTLADGTEQTFLPEDHVLINRDGFALAE